MFTLVILLKKSGLAYFGSFEWIPAANDFRLTDLSGSESFENKLDMKLTGVEHRKLAYLHYS
jgi:hypothetical protein